MSDLALRRGLIRLAHEQPQFRGAILPLLKEAGCEKLPEGPMRANCEKKKGEKGDKEASQRQGGMAMVRRVVTLAVRVLSIKKDPMGDPNDLHVLGQISMDFGQTDPDSVRFVATVSKAGGTLVVTTFQPVKPVSGSGAAGVLKMLQSALQEALDAKGEALLAPGLR